MKNNLSELRKVNKEIRETLMGIQVAQKRIKTSVFVFCLVLLVGMTALKSLGPELSVWVGTGLGVHNIMFFILFINLNNEKKQYTEKLNELLEEEGGLGE